MLLTQVGIEPGSFHTGVLTVRPRNVTKIYKLALVKIYIRFRIFKICRVCIKLYSFLYKYNTRYPVPYCLDIRSLTASISVPLLPQYTETAGWIVGFDALISGRLSGYHCMLFIVTKHNWSILNMNMVPIGASPD